ncbi:cobalamin biosynthesis protein CobD [Sorangium cellulosum]|uniref:Cobalamin biosynthesis protein CobD n=1 Tax=Sorangium cellulosum TaxID=56 RepID=A0A4P2PT78_SORCE|nr:cobalamin biosynthesis protein [Sorangium cellulosum]AUX19817.1 cobalamin biosynthesis protein CobD [Sorangium cellulosum]
MTAAAALLVAVALDLACGEPPAAVHPVVWMGNAINALKRRAPAGGRVAELLFGALMALAVPCLFAALGAGIAALIAPHPVLSPLLLGLLLKPTFALRALRDAALGVRDALATGDVPAARGALRSLCSRDPSELDEPALVAASIESVAENASDSFVAPLFYFALFGLPGALFYRAVNTLDAMVGYHGRYEHLGKASARLDDALNFVPARLTALLLLAAGWLRGADARRGLAVLRRDGGLTESPNAGRPMAAMAGLLRVELEKRGHYRLGDPVEPLRRELIDEACRIVVLAALLFTALAAVAAGAGGHGGAAAFWEELSR